MTLNIQQVLAVLALLGSLAGGAMAWQHHKDEDAARDQQIATLEQKVEHRDAQILQLQRAFVSEFAGYTLTFDWVGAEPRR